MNSKSNGFESQNNVTTITYTNLIQFFIPLAIQAFSQSLTYPLVSIVASRAEGGPLNLAGLSQATTILWLLGTLGSGLMTAGMVYGKTKNGYKKFCFVNYLIAGFVIFLQLIISIKPISHLLFSQFMGLPPSIEEPAYVSLFASIPLQLLFFLRNPFQLLLYLNKAPGKAGFASLSRILLTIILSPIFCFFGLIGVKWAVVCLTIPVLWEVIISWYFSLPFKNSFLEQEQQQSRIRDIIFFNIPLSIGGIFMSFASPVISGFISRTADPEIMLTTYYLVFGIFNPLTSAAARIQTLVLAFPVTDMYAKRIIRRFTLVSGLILGLLPLITLFPFVAHAYYVSMQNLDPAHLVFVYATSLLFMPGPLSIALRNYQEGKAANINKPGIILAGEFVFLIALLFSGVITIFLKFPGNLIGPFSIIFANLAEAILVFVIIKRYQEKLKVI